MCNALLAVRLRHNFNGSKPARHIADLDLQFALTKPWSVLFGPSGVGKSTVLRAIAGLLRPQEARIPWAQR